MLIKYSPVIRGLLRSPAGEGEGSSGGDEKKFSQADLDKILGDRLGKTKAEKAELEKQFASQKTALEQMQAQLAELSGAAEKAKEEAELKGKSDLEKLQHQLSKAQERIKAVETERDQTKATLSADLEKAKQTTVDYAKRQAITAALSGGVADGMTKHAVRAVLEEAQIELNDKFEPVKVLYDGREFDKLDAFAGEFFKANKGFAKAPQGGSGHPLNSPSIGKPNGQTGTAEEFFAAGLSKPPIPAPGASGLF